MAFILSVGILSAFGCDKESVPSTEDLPISNPSPDDDGEEEGGPSGDNGEEGGSSGSGNNPTISGGNGSIDGPTIPTPSNNP